VYEGTDIYSAEQSGADLAIWAFLSGQPQAVEEVWQAFGLTVKRRAKGVVDHPTWTFLIDREGMVRYRYFGSLLEVDTIAEDMRTLW
jgi:cytochrome oxidase Cu insertion factor (SCO1/SenC/PrrC family)